MPEGRRIVRRAAFVLAAQLVAAAVAAVAVAGDRAVVCAADCDGDERVTIDEITRCASTLLTDGGPVPGCCDVDGDSVLTVSDLVVGVVNALDGCAAPCSLSRACGEGEQCDVWDSACRGSFGDYAGVCVPRPLACPADEQPVCACNGVTYRNDCERRRAGASRQGPGQCQTLHCCPAGAIAAGSILVDFAPGTTEEEAAAIATALGAEVRQHFANIDVYVISVPIGHEIELVARFAAEPAVVSASADHVLCYPEATVCACCPPSDRLICPDLPPCLPS